MYYLVTFRDIAYRLSEDDKQLEDARLYSETCTLQWSGNSRCRVWTLYSPPMHVCGGLDLVFIVSGGL